MVFGAGYIGQGDCSYNTFLSVQYVPFLTVRVLHSDNTCVTCRLFLHVQFLGKDDSRFGVIVSYQDDTHQQVIYHAPRLDFDANAVSVATFDAWRIEEVVPGHEFDPIVSAILL